MAIGPLKRFNPPAYLTDFEAKGLTEWSDTVENWFKLEIAGEQTDSYGPRTKLTHFFNGRKTAFDQDQKPTPITWSGFPLKVIGLLRSSCIHALSVCVL